MSEKKNIEKRKKFKTANKPVVSKTGPGQYVKEVRLELKKVSWPSRSEVITFTIIVIVMVIIFGLFTFGLDSFFQYLIKLTTELKK